MCLFDRCSPSVPMVRLLVRSIHRPIGNMFKSSLEEPRREIISACADDIFMALKHLEDLVLVKSPLDTCESVSGLTLEAVKGFIIVSAFAASQGNCGMPLPLKENS